MASSIARLREALGELLQFYPLVLRNVFERASSSSSSSATTTATTATTTTIAHDPNHMADAVEGFLTELTRALSIGLHEGDGFELWSVLELLECVPSRMQAEAEAEASAAASRARVPAKGLGAGGAQRTPTRTSASVSLHSREKGVARGASSATPSLASSAAKHAPAMAHESAEGDAWRHHLQRYHFASQLVYVVRSTFPAAPRPLQARILLRLALNQGCLLAALELLRRWCRTELEGFYVSNADAAASHAFGIGGALLTQPDTDSDVWNAFVAAIAPVGGPPVIEIAAGAPKVSAQAFHLQLVVAGLDDDSVASLEYYTQLHSYVRGRRSTRPSALMCYAATQQQHRRGAMPSAASLTGTWPLSLTASQPGGRGGGGGGGAVPAQQRRLQVEALPVSTTTASQRGSDEASSASRSTSVSARQQRQRQQRRRRRRRKRRVLAEGEEEEAAVVGLREKAVSDASRSSSSSQTAHRLSARLPSCCESSSRASSSSHQRACREGQRLASKHPIRLEEIAKDASHSADGAVYAPMEDAPSVPPRSFLSVADGTSGCREDAPEDDVAEATASRTSASSLSLPPELVELHRRVLQCWAMAVTHAESQERERLSARDADANDAAVLL